MVKAILFDIENTLLCPEVPAVQRFAALRLHGEPLFTENHSAGSRAAGRALDRAADSARA